MRLARLLLIGLLAALPCVALAQGTVLQAGPTAPGRAPMYVGTGSSQPIVQDSGPASGGAVGLGLSELGITARGTGAPPYAGQGTGEFGSNFCMRDAPITNAAGYHYLCLSANAQGGGLLAYGAAGAATQHPLQFIVNGATYQFPFSTPASTTPTLDVFTIGGQSNAVGDGAAEQSCTLPANVVYQYYQAALTNITGDPVGNATSGSAWPCFALAYYNATGRKLLFVPTAVGSSAQTAAADLGAGNWDDPAFGGTLYNTSVAKTDAALTAATAAGFVPSFKGVLWNQGETDAFGITGGLITQDQYKIAFLNMKQRYRARYGAQMPFYLFRIGQPLAAPDAGFDAIRSGQEDIMSLDKYGKVVFRATVDFPALGMMNADGLHYLQNGLNFMGQVGAMNVVSANAHNGWQTYECPYNICVANRASEMTWYANGPVGIGPGSSAGLISSLDAAVPPSLLYLIDTGTTVKQQIIKSSGTGGAGIELKALGAGGRDWGVISAANGATDCGGGTFCLYDYTAGGPRLSINTTGGVRMFTYGAGVLFFDALGNINVVGSPVTGTKTVRAAGGAADCTLIFSVGVLTGGTC